MRDLKPLQPDSVAYAAGAAAGVSASSSVLPRGGTPAGPTAAAASAASAFEPSIRLNATRVDQSMGRGKGCLASATCNTVDNSDYEYVWNMSPATPVSSTSKRILPKLRPKQQNPHQPPQQQQPPHHHQRPETMMTATSSRPSVDLNRPDLVSKLDGADADALGRSNSSSSNAGAFPVAAAAIQCTCRLDERRRATATNSRPTDEALDLSGSPQRMICNRSWQSPGEEAAIASASHRATPDSKSSSATTTPTSGAGITIGAKPEAADACRRICRHCGHAVLDGSGSVRFAPGTGTTAIVHDIPGFGSSAKRSIASDDATTMKRGFNPTIVNLPHQHKH